MPIAFASPHAPEQERDALTTSADSLQLLRPHPPLASSPPKKRVVFAPDDNTGCPPPPPPHGRPVRDPKIPIAPAQPNRASSFPRFPPYEAFGRRPRAQSQRTCKGPASETFSQAVVANRGRGRCGWGRPLKCEANFGLITLHHPSLLRAAATGARNIGCSVWRSPPKAYERIT
jgi:hypothetical protein